MQQATRPRPALSLRVLLFMVWLLLASWPFWIAPSHRTMGFLSIYFLLVWIALILVLWVLARADDREPRPPNEGG